MFSYQLGSFKEEVANKKRKKYQKRSPEHTFQKAQIELISYKKKNN